MENLSEILDRVTAAAKWQRDASEKAQKQAQEASTRTGDFEKAEPSTANWFEGHTLGISTSRRDAANILDSVAVALATVLGTEVPNPDEAQERLVAKAKQFIAETTTP